MLKRIIKHSLDIKLKITHEKVYDKRHVLIF